MTGILGLLSFTLFIALIVGLIKPSLVLRWTKKPTRLKVIGYWFLSILITGVLSSVFIDKSINSKENINYESKKFTSKEGKEIEISSLVGMNVFDVATKYSKVSPETLIGTNNERWIVFYSDINVTLETKKATDIVQIAKKGKKPKNSIFEK